MTRVAIVGSGLIGRAWAVSFARAGHEVVLWDEDSAVPRKALDFIRGVLPELARNELLDGRDPDEVFSGLRIESDLAAALSGADYVQESTPERLETKITVFGRLDALTPPGAVIASSSSAILSSFFTEMLAGRARCLIVHPINPPYLVPAVEVVPHHGQRRRWSNARALSWLPLATPRLS